MEVSVISRLTFSQPQQMEQLQYAPSTDTQTQKQTYYYIARVETEDGNTHAHIYS